MPISKPTAMRARAGTRVMVTATTSYRYQRGHQKRDMTYRGETPAEEADAKFQTGFER
jgi:hypothetical protein